MASEIPFCRIVIIVEQMKAVRRESNRERVAFRLMLVIC